MAMSVQMFTVVPAFVQFTGDGGMQPVVYMPFQPAPVQGFSHSRQSSHSSDNSEAGTRVGPPGNFNISKPPGVFNKHSSEKAHGAAALANIIAQIDAGGESKKVALESIQGKVQMLAFDKVGCRVVQKAIEEADPRQAASLAREMGGVVRNAAVCPHANYVLQRIIEVLPASSSSFISEELLGMAAEISQHRAGCRVLCRLTEHAQSDACTQTLLEEVLKSVIPLARHAFGHFVIQSVLEHGTDDQRTQVARALQGQVVQESQGRSSRYVVESALEWCSLDDKAWMIDELTSPPSLMKLSSDQHGCHVLRTLLKCGGEFTQTQAAIAWLRESAAGRRLLQSSK
jgi:hypothetical protein